MDATNGDDPFSNGYVPFVASSEKINKSYIGADRSAQRNGIRETISRTHNSFVLTDSSRIKNANNLSAWRELIKQRAANGTFSGIGDFGNVTGTQSSQIFKGVGNLCKVPGCKNICGPLHLYPGDLQKKVINREFTYPKRCVDCITASRLPMPQQVVNAVRHTLVTPSDASGTARSSHAHPGGCFEGIPCRLDSLEEKIDNMSCALSPNGTLGSLIALNSKLVHLHALNELHAVGMLGFDSAPLRITLPFAPRIHG